MLTKRLLSTTSAGLFQFDPLYRFKCGLEIHTQLKTRYKLFSLSPTSFNSEPNSKISYFDIAIPGTQPKLNPEALLLALKLSTALGCQIQPKSRFDRKHYFYPDQPLGYQITQFYHPLAKHGEFKLTQRYDNLEKDKTINIQQIQIEQDTGKIIYDKHDGLIKIDLNRANVPLIELITDPDFENLAQIKSFLKKYQLLVKHLDICTGDLETGAIRVDVNVSVNGGNRVEIKNLGSTGEIQDAVIYEYTRQISELQQSRVIQQETRGWNGKETVRSRSKEDAVDYRYFPDSELPIINLDSQIGQDIAKTLPEFPDQLMANLVESPYKLELKHARFLVEIPELLKYYQDLFSILTAHKVPAKQINNWFIHEVLGAFNKLDISVDPQILPSSTLAELILKVKNDAITLTVARTVLSTLIAIPGSSIDQIIKENGLAKPQVDSTDMDQAVTELCQDIVDRNPDVVEKIRNGKKNSVNYLLGLAMKETKGKVGSKLFLQKFQALIK